MATVLALRNIALATTAHRATVEVDVEDEHRLLEDRIVTYRIDGALFFGAAQRFLTEFTNVTDVDVVILRLPDLQLDSEHARRALGEVAVPFGVCTEPSNVRAGGGACPSGSAVPAATTFAPTSPTLRTCRPISTTSFATVSACSPALSSTSGPGWAYGFREPEHLISLALLDRGGYCPSLPGRP